MRRIEREKKLVGEMIGIYCRNRHAHVPAGSGSKNELCSRCQELYDYAQKRVEKCMYGEDKPTCEACTVHCYKPEMRDQIRSVMRYSGPRLIFYHPVEAMIHLVRRKKKER